MKWWEIIIIILAVTFIFYIIIKSLLNKKKGKISCGSDCTCCSHYKECQKTVYDISEELKKIKD